MYKYNFTVPASWKGQAVNIVFDGSMTDTEVKINGKNAGDIHQGSFYRFKYDITDKLIFGSTNLLEVTVSKLSADESVNRAERYGDYWNFGGIYRPVFLEAFPAEHISRVAINAKADGSFAMDVFPEKINGKRLLLTEIIDKSGNIAGSTTSTVQQEDSMLTVKYRINNPLTWTSETPDLYSVRYSLLSGKKVLYTSTEKFITVMVFTLTASR
jgi:beta-galactosidase/beta-glucuronidase